MNFYGIEYLTNASNFNNYLKYGLLIGSLIFLIIVFSLYLRHRLNTKYRDLSIIMLLLLLLSLGMQYNDYQIDKQNSSASTQMVAFIKNVAVAKGVSEADVFVSSTRLQDQMLVKIGSVFYRVSLATDSSNYLLQDAYPVNSEVNIVK